MKEYVSMLDQGRVIAAGAESAMVRIEEKDWNVHPSFAGVALKHLLTSKDTGGNMSLHLVRIDPGCSIGSHVHEHNWELHQVVAGQGQCHVCGEVVEYGVGVQASLPNGEAHEVHAGAQGLRLIATFSPPLV